METNRKTLEATIDREGQVHLILPIKLDRPARALVTIIPEASDETALLSEPSLAEDWNRPEEDVAWSHLQSAR